MKNFILVNLVLILSFALFACSPEKAISPEQAVYRKIRQYQDILPDTIQLQPAVRFRNSIFVLGIYNFNSQSKQAQDWGQHCIGLFEVERIELNWKIYGGHRSCSSNLYRDVFSTSMGVGVSSDVDETSPYSYMIGETVIADAATVEITWEDGEILSIPVIHDYFIAFREGTHNPINFVVLDKDEIETYQKTP